MHEYYISAGVGLLDGHYIADIEITGRVDGNPNKIVTSTNSVVRGSIVIRDANGNDVTEYYDITLADGTLTVYPDEESMENNT